MEQNFMGKQLKILNDIRKIKMSEIINTIELLQND